MRSRNIKPGFFDNEELSELKPLTRILFIGLWCFADRNGRFEWRPKKIKVKILPYDNGDITVLLQELVNAGFILQYSIQEIQYGQVNNFTKHQRPHHTEKDSKIPPLENNGDITVNSPLRDGEYPPDSLIPDSLIPDSPSPQKGEKIYNPDSVEFQLSNLLLSKILERNPNFKKPDLQKWAVHTDKMIRLDKRDPPGIKRVIEWCQEDDFWMDNILSTKKLRDQYDQLLMKMKAALLKKSATKFKKDQPFKGTFKVPEPIPDEERPSKEEIHALVKKVTKR